MAAAIAMAEYLTRTKTPGSIAIYGTPGEDMMPPNAKTVMHEAHTFDAPTSSSVATRRAGRRGRRTALDPAA